MGFDSKMAFSPDGSQNEKRLRLLVETGILLASERSLDVIVQAALDAGLHLCSARYGAFFYNNIGDDNKSYSLYKEAGPDLNIFATFPEPHCTEIPKDSFLNQLIIRSPDITLDPRFTEDLPFADLSPHHAPVRSYLSVPVRSRAGESLGCLIYGHPDVDHFTLSLIHI